MELTSNKTTANLTVPPPYEVVEFGSSFNQGQKRPVLSLVFLCLPKIINTGLVRVKAFMVGVLVSSRACRFLDPVFQTSTSTAQSLEASDGSLKTTVKESAMSQHSQIQNPTKANTHTNSVSLKSIFSLLDSNKNPIASSLTFEQVKPLSEHIQGSVIKFQAMVKIGVLS